MTGAGLLFAADRAPVLYSFSLHCDVSRSPNRLRVTWNWHSTFELRSLASASCSDDPNIRPGSPAVGFDTYRGAGTGFYNGAPGAAAQWTFTDAGEPGTNDFARIKVIDANGNVVLQVAGNLIFGNNQAQEN
jgi:hypothetical protein